METTLIPPQLTQAKKDLGHHPLFAHLGDVKALQTFMETHVYAVWDFMSLLKSLQREISCVQVPWTPSRYSKQAVRLINEIVLGEESDVDASGEAMDHFSMYLAAMEEVGANTAAIREFLATLDMNLIPEHARNFVQFNIDLATKAPAHLVAGAFFFGREDLIPTMFDGMLNELDNAGAECPRLRHYLVRHIELDGDEHGPLAMQMLHELTNGEASKLEEAFAIGQESLKLRSLLWDGVLAQLKHA